MLIFSMCRVLAPRLAHALELFERARSVTAVPDQTALHPVIVRVVVDVHVGNAILQAAVVV